jgi:hypothetical protein
MVGLGLITVSATSNNRFELAGRSELNCIPCNRVVNMDEKVPDVDPRERPAIEDVGPAGASDEVSMKFDGGFRDNEVGEMPSPSPSKNSETSSYRPMRSMKRNPLTRLSSAVIDINSLPPDVAETLRQFDINGDGQISVTEMVHGAMTQVEQEEKVFD